MLVSKHKIKNITRSITFICFAFSFCSFAFGQAGKDLPIIEDFEKDSAWHWKPWEFVGNGASVKSKASAHSGMFGLYCQNYSFLKRYDLQIGLPGQVISCWFRIHGKTNAYLGFGQSSMGNGYGYYLVLSPDRNSFDFRKSADYTYPNLKTISQTYQLNVWYRAEVVFNTTTNITGNLYAANGTTLLNSITVEIPELLPGGIAFRGSSVSVDDIRGGSKQEFTDNDFAPKLGVPLVLKNILFETNKSILLKESYAELNKLVAFLKRNPSYKIIVNGHTDNTGNEKDNLNLSKERAKAVTDYIIEKGINKDLVKYFGLGSSKPIASNDNEDDRKINRRVECTIDNK